jgi:hypothetical protein
MEQKMKKGNAAKGGMELDPELRRRIKLLAKSRHIFLNAAIDEMARSYLGKWELVPPICRAPKEHQRLIDQAIEVSTSGGHPESEAAISLLRIAIVAAHRLISPPPALAVVGGRNEQPSQ